MSGKTGILVVVLAIIAAGIGYALSKGDFDPSKLVSPMSMDPH